jgi:pimeloyl-ACP methyl ester carboxylesterase
MEHLRIYGNPPYAVAVIHGGPGAPGEMAPVAKALSIGVGVLEPLQTQDSVGGQVKELKDVLEKNGELPLTVLGYSWGAWLGFILTAQYPSLVKKLILVSSGPFEEQYVAQIMQTRLSRLSPEEREQISRIMKLLQLGERNREVTTEFGALMDKADSFNPVQQELDDGGFEFQEDIYQKVWTEASSLRKSGALLKYADSIRCPVVAIHGEYDPHPAQGVAEPLSRTLRNFQFNLLQRCGHTPWKEKEGKDVFYATLGQELSITR